jgi:hypothetical protein
MRIRTIGAAAATAVLLTACGSTGGKSAALLRPPSPVNLSVYVDDVRVSVSPSSVGAGPVVFLVTNQASSAQSLAISRGSQTVASTAPINPQGTTQVTVDIKPGVYSVGPAGHGSTDAQQSIQPSIQPATIQVGRQRPNSSSEVGQP